MRKDLLAIGLGLVLSGVTVVSSFAAGGTVTLRDHVPALVAHGKAQLVGDLPGDTTMNLSIGLPLRNRAALTNLLEQLYNPNSPNYHQFLTPKQFTEHFGPTEKDYEAVIKFARQNGFEVTRTHPNRMLLNIRGHAADVQRTFGVNLHEYQHPTEARQFFAPDRNPTIPAGLAIQEVTGLDNFRRPVPNYHLKPGSTPQPVSTATLKIQRQAAAKPGATTGSGPAGNYIGDDFRNAYVPGTLLNGAGQSVALVQFDGYLTSDIQAYETLTGRPNVNLQNILLDGFSGIPTGTGGEIEVSLDIEMVISMAPGVSTVYVYEGDPFNFFPNDVLNQIAVDNAARQVSASWGWIGGPNTTTDQIFQQMAAQGQSFFHSSADSDAFLPGEVDDPNQLFEPSSSPYITQCGGTTLTMNGRGATYRSETVWNWGNRYPGQGFDGVGSSGGISSTYSIPSWQSNINMSLPQGSATLRNIPDVAMTADDTLVIADGGLEYVGVGGTSVASPLWAGFMALVNEQAVINGRAPVGFLNPAVYAIAQTTSYTNCFHDTTTGDNTWSLSPGLFHAVPGYDLCTGLGTPNGTNLINAILAQAVAAIHISPPPPPYGMTLSNLTGGNPNGPWQLFVQDDAPLNSGEIVGGWVLSLSTADIIGTAGDVQTLMTTTNTTALLGQPVTFVVTVTNYGPSTSTNVVVTDELPLSVTVLSTNTTQGSVSRAGTTLIWNVGSLGVNFGAAMTLTVQPKSVGSFANTATVNAGTPDPNPDDDVASTNVFVVPLSFSLTPSFANSNHTFQISIPGPSGVTMVIQANSNLLNTNWVNIYTGTPPINFVDPAPSNTPTRFYRSTVVP